MRVLIVGGTWTCDGGHPSGLINKIATKIKQLNTDTVVHNGGCVAYLKQLCHYTTNFDVVLWWANVPDNEMLWEQNKSIEEQKKQLRNIKFYNPKIMFVGSKRNNDEYTFAELITKSLSAKHNLCVEFSRIPFEESTIFKMRLFDPLGVVWYEGTDLECLCKALINRLQTLVQIQRVSTKPVNDEVWGNVKHEPDEMFLTLIRKYADKFHELIHPAGTERMLGNCSFRCQRGFPSYRSEDGIYVSRRNVDKRFIDKNMFVKVRRNNDNIEYFGEHKPSVDTPIQLALYEKYPNINFMIHSHCYIKDAEFTKTPIPCGGLQEVDEICNALNYLNSSETLLFAQLNLIGHGSIVLSNTVKMLNNIEYIERELPENVAEIQ